MNDIFTRKRFTFNLASASLTAAFGVIAGALIMVFSGWSLYRWIFVAFIIVIIPGLFMLFKNVTRTLLFALILAIPISFSLAPFGKAPFHQGGAQPVIVFGLYDFPLMGLIAVWLFETLVQRKPIRKSIVILAAVGWITWSVLSLYNSTNLQLSVLEIIRMAKLFILMIAVSCCIRDKADIKAVLYALFFGLIVQSIISAIQYTTNFTFNLGLYTVGSLNRVSGTIGWPNTLGAYAATISAIAFILLINHPEGKLRGVSLITGIAGLFTLIVSFSRGAWVAFFIALVLGICLSYWRKSITLKDIGRFGLISLILALITIPLFWNKIAARLAETSLQQGAIADRFSLNLIAYDMIAAHPIIGIGINTFVEVMRSYDTTGVSYSLLYPVHNVFLLIAAETGIAGLGLFIVLLVAIFREALRTMRKPDLFIATCTICLMSGLTAILISNLADNHLKTDVLFALFWFLAGLGIALSGMTQASPNLSNRQNRHANSEFNED